MSEEIINIYDENYQLLGTANRDEIHLKGYWHETFHCWVMSRENGRDFIHLQIRSAEKQDYPSLLDITAAGHIMAEESIADGIREVKEELGIEVSMEDLISLDVIKYCVILENFIDKELANVFLYKNSKSLLDYEVQREEVSGIVQVDFDQFTDLWLGKREEVQVQGFELNSAGEKIKIDKLVKRNDFVPHENSYYERIIELIRNHI
ncbi:NUDIX hydrolase [Cytobacillus sp. FJAT-54145]|uniref:NUDIX hydrolase n=1 Tax=Cytobacillus spartinae TaxID=3299023 RepID=A0ABW6KJA1_9BACI